MSDGGADGHLSHRCLACGRSCHGVKVRLISPEEAERIERAGARLGVERPVVDGVLRREAGACVFQQSDGLCRIHAELGAEVKPHVCRQYPWVLVETETGEQRIGIDPGCYTWSETAAEPVTPIPDDLQGRRITLPPPGRQMEAALLTAVPTTVVGWARRLKPNRDLDAWRVRWVRTLRAMPLADLVGRDDAGPSLREVFRPLLDLVPTLSEAPPPPLPGPALDAVAAEAVKRVVRLRMMSEMPPPLVVELLLGGALAQEWTDPADRRLLAAWVRAARAPVFASRWVEAFQAAGSA